MTIELKEEKQVNHVCRDVEYETSEDGTKTRFKCLECGAISEWENIDQEEY